MDGLGVRPVLVESMDESPPVGVPSVICVMRVEPLLNSTTAVSAVLSSLGRRRGGEGGGLSLVLSS